MGKRHIYFQRLGEKELHRQEAIAQIKFKKQQILAAKTKIEAVITEKENASIVELAETAGLEPEI